MPDLPPRGRKTRLLINRKRKEASVTTQEAAARLTTLADQDFPESWIPSAEESMIVGEFVRLEQGPTVRGPAWIVVLKTEDGRERSVWLLHTVLRNELARQRPEPGELVLVKYEGKKESSAGQPYEAYRVLVDRDRAAPDWDAVDRTSRDGADDAPDEDEGGGVPFS
jgi:hypothetical protein